jgi:archaellum biogenesis protein FlaJ (TadC family)
MKAARPLTLALIALMLVAPLAGATAPTIHAVDPTSGATVRTVAPILKVNFTDPEGDVDPSSVKVELDGIDALQEFSDTVSVTADGVVIAVPSILPLRLGDHFLNVTVRDKAGGSSALSIPFVVNTTALPTPPKPIPLGLIVGVVAGSLALAGAAATGGYLYLRRTRRFTLRKYFLRNPEKVRFIVLYAPSGLAVALTIGVLFYVSTLAHAPRFAAERTMVVGAFLAFGPYGIDVIRKARRLRACERAFAQFLFELSDAVRGGIDPVKAVLELAKTEEGILAPHVRRAADVLRLGRPLEEAMRFMSEPLGSELVTRYGALVGEASAMGGSIAGVIQRAAKDMDELVKIGRERDQALRTPVMTMYMAFGVLLIMVLQLVSFAPTLGAIDVTALGGAGTAKVPRLPVDVMQTRFFHLLLLNGAGAGLLVGAFVSGKVKNGIVHAMVMVAIATVVYPLTL